MPEPLVLTREQSRLVDKIAIERWGFSGLVLMENAGRGAVDVLLAIDPAVAVGRVAILCGKGNNAGDGFVIARHLAIRGVDAVTVLLCSPTELTGDALANYQILLHTQALLVDASAVDVRALPEFLELHAGGARWIVDAMLGTGAQGAPREPFDAAIRWANSQSGRRLGIDVPSGLDCETGKVVSVAVRAHATCTFVAAKPGFLLAEAAASIGELHIASIGIPDRMIRQSVHPQGRL